MQRHFKTIAILFLLSINLIETDAQPLVKENLISIDKQNSIYAEEIISKIKAGKQVYYNNIIIIGDLDISDLNLSSTIRSNIKIINSVILGKVDLSGYKYENPVDFSNSTFKDMADFSGIEFASLAYFVDSRYNNKVTFQSSRFNRDASFRYAKFERDANFEDTRYYGEADFRETTFGEDAFFRGSAFLEIADFIECKVLGSAFFGNATFKNAAQFSKSRFKKYADFSDAQFTGNAIFAMTEFSNAADFKRSNFKENANFLATKFQSKGLFQYARFGGDTDFSEAFLNRNINLSKATLRRFNIEWNLLKDRLDYDGSAYLALVKSYRDLEMFDYADSCYYDYRKIGQEKKPIGLSKGIDIIAEKTCGYGVRPDYTLWLSLLVILVFSLIYWIGNSLNDANSCSRLRTFSFIKLSTVSKIDIVDSFTNAIQFSSSTFISLAMPEWRPSSIFWKWIIITERLIGWLLLALLLVTLGHVMIR